MCERRQLPVPTTPARWAGRLRQVSTASLFRSLQVQLVKSGIERCYPRHPSETSRCRGVLSDHRSGSAVGDLDAALAQG
jgi:hypothetical protein